MTARAGGGNIPRLSGSPQYVIALRLGVAVLVLAGSCCAFEDEQPHWSILQEQSATVRLSLVDASSHQPLAGAVVELSERVVCDTTPCPPKVAWKHAADGSGSVTIPRNFVTKSMLVGAPAHAVRELGAASWSNERRRWVIPLLPTPTATCTDPSGAWTILIAADRRSAEVKHEGRATQFGLMQCDRSSQSCWSPDVADAGFGAYLATRGADITAIHLQAESIAGARDIAKLSCGGSQPPVNDANQMLAGSWYQSGWKLCTPVPQLGPDDVDVAIERLEFDADGTFSVTWPGGGARTTGPPHVFVPDYRGTYTIDSGSKTIRLRITSGFARHFSGEGTFEIGDDTITFRNVWFGTRQASKKPDICELTFKRQQAG